MPVDSATVHGSVVALGARGVLLRGPSGAGKSDLALRLIAAGADLVADDQVRLALIEGCVWAAAPAAIAGLIEIRGIGIRRLRHRESARLSLIVDLQAAEPIERLPDPAVATLLGIALPRVALAPFEESAPLKVAWALEGEPRQDVGPAAEGA